MDYKIRLTAALPKGDLNGWDDRQLAEEVGETRIQRRNEQPRVALVVYETRETSTGKGGVVTTVLEIARVQPVQTLVGRAIVSRLLDEEYDAQRGTMPSHEVHALSKRAFVDLPRDTAEIDQEEAAEQDTMSPTDELRRHLERVHGRAEAAGLTALEAEQLHEADHVGGLSEVLAHNVEWMGWTRADLEAAADMAEDEPAAAFASGGLILSPLTDELPSALESGEYVVKASQTNDVPSALDDSHPLFSEERSS